MMSASLIKIFTQYLLADTYLHIDQKYSIRQPPQHCITQPQPTTL